MQVVSNAATVDKCTVTPDGKVRLVAHTQAALVDVDEVRQLVLAKLTTYLDYITSAAFRATYGADKPIEIIFRCVAEPAQPVLRAALDLGTSWHERTGINVPIYWIWHEEPQT